MEERTPNLNRLTPLLLDWYSAHARDLPWRRTRDPYAIWVSEIMLQQTQVKTVIPYWKRWMRELPSVQALARANPARIHKLWEGLGYYTRVRNLQKAAKQIVEQHGGRFPDDFDAVLALPGIGRYTAGAICSIAFNQPRPILDGNVTRVLTRFFGLADNPREKKANARLWEMAARLVELAAQGGLSKSRTRTKDDWAASHFNQSLMELGALVCTPRKARCLECPLKKFCVAFREDRVADLPNLGRRVASTERRFAAFVVESRRRFLVRQRPAGVVNAHLWEFPNVEIQRPNPARPGAVADAAERLFGGPPAEVTPFCTIKHSITRYRITLEAFQVKPGSHHDRAGIWRTPAQMHRLAFASAHKKILKRIMASNGLAR